MHAEKALDSIESRLSDLQSALTDETAQDAVIPIIDIKGKGKAKLMEADAVSTLSKTQIEGEIKELSSLKGDLALKVRRNPCLCSPLIFIRSKSSKLHPMSPSQ